MTLQRYSDVRCHECGQGLTFIEVALGRSDDKVCGHCLMNRIQQSCDHNEMVANNSQTHAWRCAKCGYVYGGQ